MRAALALLASLLLASPASAETADTVLYNGKIVTVDKDFSVREAIAISHGRVLATGTSGEMRKLADKSAKQIDLGGRTVIDRYNPGPRSETSTRPIAKPLG